MANLYKKPVWITDPKTGKKRKEKSKKWWGRFKDASGRERRVPLASDRMAAQALLNQRLVKVDREMAGLVEPSDDQRKRPLAKHWDEFKKYLQNKGVTPKQVNESTKQIQKLIDACKWKMISDISASAALEFLGGLREAGKSAQTYNHYLKSVKQFTRWLVRDRRMPTDPLAHLSKLNVGIDRRHDRRALSPDEFRRLVDAAKAGSVVETIPGPDRALMYVLAAWTGFRKGEVGSLTMRSFELDDDPPTATVAACYSKRKRQDSQILHPELVRQLRQWLIAKPDLEQDDLLFPVSGRVPGGTERKTHKMMETDLKAARSAWINDAESEIEKAVRENSDFLKYCDDNGQFADFHSNRHLFITSLERANLSPKMAQTLARHSDVRLTLGIYTHVGLHDQTLAIESLPAPPSTGVGAENEVSVLRATGTDGTVGFTVTPQMAPPEVPTMVPSGADFGAIQDAPVRLQFAPVCTDTSKNPSPNGVAALSVTRDDSRRVGTKEERSASLCTGGAADGTKYPQEDSNLQPSASEADALSS